LQRNDGGAFDGNYYAVDTALNFVIGYGRGDSTLLGIGEFDGAAGDDLLFERGDGSYVVVDGQTKTPAGLNRDAADMFAGIADVDGNGTDEVLFKVATTGGTIAVDATGTLVLGYGRTTQDVVAVADFDGDGADDLLFDDALSDAFIAVDGATRAVQDRFISDGSVVSVGNFMPNAEDDLLIEATDGSYRVTDTDGTELASLGRPGDMVLAPDPLGTGVGLLEDILII
ncbi:MAG: hypothetical protein AAF638_05565, partial [Pseudomonadota bacterium]